MSDGDFKPQLIPGFDLTTLSLGAEEGFLLSRIDGATSMRELTHLTGFSAEQVQRMVQQLADAGALEKLPEKEAPTTDDDLAAALADDELMSLEGNAVSATADEDPQEGDGNGDDEDDKSGDDKITLDDESVQRYRRLFREKWKDQDLQARQDAASKVRGEDLLALCFDGSPGVIRNLVNNQFMNVEAARLIASFQRHSVAIDALTPKAALLRDKRVQRGLLRNALTSETTLRKLLAPRSLSDLFRTNRGGELSDRARRVVRNQLRKTWSNAGAEEKVALIMKTEGRCLNMFIGLPFGGKTGSVLASRSMNSAILIQNLCRFSGLPPVVLQHLWKQSAVKRSLQLRKQVLQHPNCPSSIKRMAR